MNPERESRRVTDDLPEGGTERQGPGRSPAEATDSATTRMVIDGTPVEDHRSEYGLVVKREDLSCPPPGPPFSKSRGVYERVASRPERIIGVLDTYHSQAGWAVARACEILGKHCLNFYPEYKNEPGPREPQERAAELGADLVSLPAGRSSILFHQARRETEDVRGGYMMPNALKLSESVDATADELVRTASEYPPDLPWLISVSSGTIASGVVRGALLAGLRNEFVLHMGYSRSEETLRGYVEEMSGRDDANLILINQEYAYRDRVDHAAFLPFPADPYYDAKAAWWWLREGRDRFGEAIFWLIG